MKDQLKKYVDLLFAGASDAEDIKQEILQNTLDRYDDLVAQGKTPEAAYRLAISGIGDINEILDNPEEKRLHSPSVSENNAKEKEAKAKSAIAIAMYIACPIPLFVLGNLGNGALGLCLLLLLVAAATALLVISGKEENQQSDHKKNYKELSPDAQLRHSIHSTIHTIALVIFLVVSFLTGAWYITWLIFPLAGAIRGLINACLDLKEAK